MPTRSPHRSPPRPRHSTRPPSSPPPTSPPASSPPAPLAGQPTGQATGQLTEQVTAEFVARELAHCYADPIYFIQAYCYILVRDDDGSRDLQRFLLWPYQVALITALFQGGHFIILKARQQGITTAIAAYCAWFAFFRPNSYLLLLSKRDGEGQKLLRRILATYDALPDWMRAVIAPGDIRNTQAVNFSNGSLVESMAATEGAGRSDTASVVFIDEADYVPNLEETYSATKPTVDGVGGQMILASTSQGPGRYFKTLWDRAVMGDANERPVFFPWWVRPDRTKAWYEHVTASYSETKRKREYPACPADAFSSSELLVYPEFDRALHMDRMSVVRRTDEDTGRSAVYVETRRYGRFRVTSCQAGQDSNFAAEGCILVCMMAADGTILVVDGWYEAGIPIVSEESDTLSWVTIARDLHRAYGYSRMHCDWNPDAIQAFGRAHLPAVRAVKDVVLGVGLVGQALKRRENGTPGLLINTTLPFVADEMESYRRRTTPSGVVKDAVVKEHDHAQDALRYSVCGFLGPKPKISVI